MRRTSVESSRSAAEAAPRARRRNAAWRLGIIACAVAGGAIAAMSMTPQTPAVTVRVEADVYSGRPNPRWTLSAANAGTLLGRLRALPAAAAAEPRDGLGYRGLIIRLDPVPDGLCATIRVANGLACCMPEPGAAARDTACRRDTDRALERWLVSSADPALEPGLLKMLTDQLKP